MATSDVPDTSDTNQVPAQRDPTPATTPAESLEDQPSGSAPDPEVRATIPHDPVLTYGKEDDDTSSAWRKH